MIIRGCDKWGSGRVGASRRKTNGKSYPHPGVDLPVGIEGSLVFSDFAGVLTKANGFPYSIGNSNPLKRKLRYVQVTTDSGFDMRYFYTKSCVAEGSRVKAGELIATAQGAIMAEIWPGITPHVHFEVKRGDEFLHPLKFLAGEIEVLNF